MIRVGIAGCGKIAQVRHIPEYEANAASKICGVFDLNPERAKEVAQRVGAKAFSSYEEMLADLAVIFNIFSANSRLS